MPTDAQVIEYLAKGDSGATRESDTQPGRSVFDAARYFSMSVQDVQAIQRAHRQEIDRKFEQRDGADWQ